MESETGRRVMSVDGGGGDKTVETIYRRDERGEPIYVGELRGTDEHGDIIMHRPGVRLVRVGDDFARGPLPRSEYAAAVPEMYRAATWAGLDAPTRLARMQIESMQQLASEILSKPRREASAYLSGPVGTGKTTLAALVALDVAAGGKRVKWISWPRLVDEIRIDTLQGGAAQSSAAMTADLLVLDDFGKGKVSDFAGRVAFDIIDARWTGRLAMVVTSNLSMDDAFEPLGAHGDAAASRLRHACGDRVIYLPGKDRRTT